MNPRQVILSLYALLFVGLGVTGLVLFKDAHDELSQLTQVEATNRQKLQEAQQRLREQEKVLERLRSDPTYVDRVIRMKMGYSKPDEFIFRFESDGAKGPAELPNPPSKDR